MANPKKRSARLNTIIQIALASTISTLWFVGFGAALAPIL